MIVFKKQVKRLIIGLSVALMICFEATAQEAKFTIRPRVLKIVSKLKNEKTIHLGEPVGLALIPETDNKYYKLYKRLDHLATDDELLALTKDSSNTILIYSFSILHSRNHSALKEIFVKHLSDTSTFHIASGCTGDTRQVNSFMFWKLSPPYYETSKIYFTKEELEKYDQLIQKL